MPEPTNLALERIARELARLKGEAEKAQLPLLAYLIDMALVEGCGRPGHLASSALSDDESPSQ